MMLDRFWGPVWVAILVGAFVLSSCSTTPSPTTSQTSTTTTKSYGSLNIQVTFSRGGAIDPHMSGSASSFQPVVAAIFDSLVELTPEGQTGPAIAERWEIAPDGKTHTFYIRKGVKFHDGSDLTGADVKFSIERVLAPQSAHVDAPIWRAAIAKVELKDDYTVALQLKLPQFELLRGFTDYSGSPAVVPKKYIEEKGVDYFAKHPVGSGPWTVLSFELGNRVELEAFEGHWRAVPKFKNLTLLAVNEEASRVAMLKTGELDLAEVSSDSVPGLKSAGVRTFGYRGGSEYVINLFYDLEHPAQYALGDVRVRKALSLAINRRELADQLGGGFADPSAIYLAPPTAYFYDASVLKPDPFDPEGAKKLLAEAGYASGFNTKLWSPAMGSGGVLNSAVAGYWRKIGVNADVIARETAAIISMYSPKHVPEIWNTAYGNVSVGGAFGFEKMTSYHSVQNSLHNTRNRRLDELIDKVPQTSDPAEKKKLALEAAVLAKNEYTRTGVLRMHTILALGSKVGGLTTVAGMSSNAYNFATITHAK